MPITGRSPSNGTFETFEAVSRSISPPITKLSPSPSSTVVSARRVMNAGTDTPLIVTALAKSSWLASGATFSAMRCGLSTVGVSVSPIQYGLNSIEVVPSACGTGIGTSPPARKLAL